MTMEQIDVVLSVITWAVCGFVVLFFAYQISISNK